MEARKVERANFRLAGVSLDEIRATLKKYNIGSIPLPGAIPITHCCKTKLCSGLPTQMYVGPRNQRFYKTCNVRKARYAILSDLYGIHFDDEALEYYDRAPGMLSNEDLWECGRLIGVKCRERKVPALHYISSPPSCSVPYLIMLMASGIPFTYSTKFPSTKRGLRLHGIT